MTTFENTSQLRTFNSNDEDSYTLTGLGGITVDAAINQDDSDLNDLKKIVNASSDVILKARTTLTLFPDEIIVDREKVSVTRRNFIRSVEALNMRIADILNVSATYGPVFGTVKITSRVMNPDKPRRIGLFWKKDAMEVKKVIQGYVIAHQKDINTDNLPVEKLKELLRDIGTSEQY